MGGIQEQRLPQEIHSVITIKTFWSRSKFAMVYGYPWGIKGAMLLILKVVISWYNRYHMLLLLGLAAVGLEYQQGF